MDLDQSSQLKEIFDILLSAGYFRCRIQSISTFDKILGGLTWCITCANFDIDAPFHDEMSMGQKIKLSEKVVQILQKMNCPYKIQPHQIQGLDLKNLYPIFQWLINFVLETRDLRQDFNKSMSIFQGKKLFNKVFQPITNAKQAINQENKMDTRVIKNSKVDQYKLNDPLRVYSCLIEFDDKTAISTYNKLTTYLAHYNVGSAQRKSIPQQKLVTKTTIEINDTENSIFNEADIVTEVTNEDKNFVDIRLQRKNTKIIGENLYKIVMENRATISKSIEETVQDKDETVEFATLLKNETEFFEDQKALIKRQIENITKKINEKKEAEVNVRIELQNFEAKKEEFSELNIELKETAEIIEEKMQMAQKSVSNEKLEVIEELKKKEEAIIEKRGQIKKEIKQEMQLLETQKAMIEELWPKYNNPIDQNLIEDYNQKKEKYDKKFKEFAELNQEISVLQRKIENYPSSVETAQYHKRFIELFDRINFEMEKYRDNFIIFNNFQDVKFCINQHIELMKSFKDGVLASLKSKSKKEEFVKNLQVAAKGLTENFKKSSDALAKMKASKEKNFETYTQLLHQERDYYRILRELQVEFEKNEHLNSLKSGRQSRI